MIYPLKTLVKMMKIRYGKWMRLVFSLVFMSESINVQAQEFKLVNIDKVDQAIEAFMGKHNAPGAAVAITKGEKLVYLKGFGYADTLRKEKVRPENLFRIASISKPVTAVAIMKLVEEGRVTLDQKVFGSDGVLGTGYGTKPYSPDIMRITVGHLLQQTCGGWGNARGKDPMFLDATWRMEKVINHTLDSIPLDYEPGTRYVYSNFGFCLLGRVIEVVSGQDYETYVKNSVLLPLGITSMQIGGNKLEDRVANEVIYYGQQSRGRDPYRYNISRMDAHGGWLASVTDLMRFMVHVDGFPNKPDLLSNPIMQLMTTVSAAEENKTYAYGWRVDERDNWWHSGSLPGTGVHLKRMSNGFNWTVLTNTRAGGTFFADLEQLLNEVVADDTIIWQEKDLFLQNIGTH